VGLANWGLQIGLVDQGGESGQRCIACEAIHDIGRSFLVEPWYELKQSPPTRRIILTMTDPMGRTLAIVVEGDGWLGITRDDQAVPGCRWEADGMEQCVDGLLRLMGQDGSGR
jgi:hypothetical protein